MGIRKHEYTQMSPHIHASCVLSRISILRFCTATLDLNWLRRSQWGNQRKWGKEGERVIKTTLLRNDYFGIIYSALFHNGMFRGLRNTVRKLSSTFVLKLLPWVASQFQPSQRVPTCYRRCLLLVNTSQGHRECTYHHVPTPGHSTPPVWNFPWLSTPLRFYGE